MPSLKSPRRIFANTTALPLALMVLWLASTTNCAGNGSSGTGGTGGATAGNGGNSEGGNSEGGNRAGNSGPTGGKSTGGSNNGGTSSGGTQSGGTQSGGSAAGGTGAGGKATGGTPATGGAGGTPMSRACVGQKITGSGGNPQVLRSDMTIKKLYTPTGSAVRLKLNPVDNKLYILTESGGISRVTLNGDTATTAPVIAAANIGVAQGSNVFGMTIGPDGSFYVVSHMPSAAVGFDKNSRATVWRGTPAGATWTWNKIAETVLYGRSNTYFDHEWSGIAVSADGMYLYVNAGSRTDHGEVEDAGGAWPNARESALTAAIFRLPTNGSNITLMDNEKWLTDNGYLFARGIRNSFDPEFSPTGQLWAGENGPDGDYHEELNLLESGKHYGFPWRLGNEDNQMQFASYNAATDKRLDPGYGATRNGQWHNDLQFPVKPVGVTFVEPVLNLGPDANQYRDPTDGTVKKASSQMPIGTFSDHGSPLGLTFDDGKGTLCGEFSDSAFILRFGRAAGAFELGQDLLHIKWNRTNGKVDNVNVTQIARNFLHPIDAVLIGSKMYVLDRGNNNNDGGLYEIQLPR
jgi:Glucose / Sorbosone dehydrogenase